MEKLSKIAKKLDLFCKILFWFIIIAAGIVFFCTALQFLVLTPESMSQYAVKEHLVLGSIKLDISEGIMPAIGNMWRTYLLYSIEFIISAIMVVCGIRIIRSILKPMKAASPFIGSVSVDLKKLGYLTLFGGAAVTVCKAIGDILFYKLFCNIGGSILKDTVTGVTYTHTYDFTFIIAAAILFLVSYAFRYGEELQQQADETL